MMARLTGFVTFGILASIVCQSLAGHWGYEGEDGPDHWADTYLGCAGQSQSPIDIKRKAASYNSELLDIDFVDDATDATLSHIVNNGHTMVISTDAEVLVNGGGLEDTYKVAQAHLHWGGQNNQGSEHTIDGHAFPMEMHIVTYNFEKYEAQIEGGLGPVLETGDPSALAVFGIFFTLSAQNNTKLEPLLAHFEAIKEAASAPVDVPDFHLWDLLPNNQRDYFRYMGSLTTPTCDEVVVWSLFDEKQTVSEYQLNQFRSLNDGEAHELQDNFRPVQPLNGRKVQASFQKPPYKIIEGESSDDEDNGAIGVTTSLVLSIACTLVSLVYRG